MTTELELALRSPRWSRTEAALVIGACRASGQSVAAFARKHDLQPQRLLRWRKKLARGEDPRVLEFAPVLVRALQPAPAADLQVSVGPGVVRVPADFDEEHLRRLLTVLARC